MRDVRAFALMALGLGLFVGCGGHPTCSAPPPQPPLGSASDVHALTSDAGFFLVMTGDGGPVRVESSGAAMHRLCNWPDAGGGHVLVYPDGGHDFFLDDGGLVDPDGGCRETEALNQALLGALEPLGFVSGEEFPRPDGTTVLSFGFHDWAKVDEAVQLTGAMLVDAGTGGPIELDPRAEGGGFCL